MHGGLHTYSTEGHRSCSPVLKRCPSDLLWAFLSRIASRLLAYGAS